jgi:hypothetical protein
MINLIMKDINDMIDSYNTILDLITVHLKLDADVKYYLHQKFLAADIFDFSVMTARTSHGLVLNVKVQETFTSSVSDLTFDIDFSDLTAGTDDAYNRAMSGV